MSLRGFCIHHSDNGRRARAEDADVHRAVEVLGVEVSVGKACISGRVRDIRRRLGTLLDDLLPPVARPALWRRLLRRVGPTVRARAVDAAFIALFDEHLPGSHHVSLCSLGSTSVSGEQVLPEKAMREVIAGALDDAYCVLLPHEAARRAEQYRAFWAD